MNKSILNIINNSNYFNSVDRHFARFIHARCSDSAPFLILAAALASNCISRGHTCIDLQAMAGQALDTIDGADGTTPIRCPELNDWLSEIRRHSWVGRPGQRRPLILDGSNRLYLYRYWEYENRLTACLRSRVERRDFAIEEKRVKSVLNTLFDADRSVSGRTDWQRIAGLVALLKSLCIITGGPGTGKTFTVAKILALLVASDPRNDWKIRLCAPTGKAANRLADSIKAAKHQLNIDEEIRSQIPEQATTVHRLLGTIDHRSVFRHDRSTPLNADAVVVDEASMVDLALMTKLFEAVPDTARLILLGDRDQLASVEAGSVLGDMCAGPGINRFSRAFGPVLEKLSGHPLSGPPSETASLSELQNCMIGLQTSYRFNPDGLINRASRLIRDGRAGELIALLQNTKEGEVRLQSFQDPQTLQNALSDQLIEGYADYLRADGPAEALRRFHRFKILCALKVGPRGADAVNAMAEVVLRRAGLLGAAASRNSPWYRGQPVLITRNQYQTGLFNGDIGIVWPAGGPETDRLRVYFPGESDRLRELSPESLPPHELAYALTVHKSQGSEFESVLLVLPTRDTTFMTRELVYTALTRARNSVTIWAEPGLLASVVRREIERTSGLRDALWNSASQTEPEN